MPGDPSSPVCFVVVGASHRSSTRAVRERLIMEEAAIPLFLERLAAAGVPQAMALSTSERVEVFAVHDRPEQAAAVITEALADQAGLGVEDLSGQLYVFESEEAVRHIFAVTAALDSLIVGEPQMLSQIQAGRSIARERRMLGPELDSVLQAAVQAAEMVRTQTDLAAHSTSIATAAVQVAGDIHGDLAGCLGLVLGPGDMGELLAEQLLKAGLGRLVITGRAATRVEQASRRLKCGVIPIDTLEEALEEADIIVASVGISGHLITVPMMEVALKRRRRKPVFLIDAAIPGDIDLSVNDLDGAFLYDLNDLERVVMDDRAARASGALAAWEIVEAEAGAYLQGEGGRLAVPAIEALRRHFGTLRGEVLASLGGADAETATQALVDRLLQDPAQALGEMSDESGAAGAGERDAAEALLLRLFGVGGGGAGAGESGPSGQDPAAPGAPEDDEGTAN
jgi:glutamyl-tRNA reductase